MPPPRTHVQKSRMARARGCSEELSAAPTHRHSVARSTPAPAPPPADADRAAGAVAGAPPPAELLSGSGSMSRQSVTVGRPRVSVPVLSNTTTSTLLAAYAMREWEGQDMKDVRQTSRRTARGVG